MFVKLRFRVLNDLISERGVSPFERAHETRNTKLDLQITRLDSLEIKNLNLFFAIEMRKNSLSGFITKLKFVLEKRNLNAVLHHVFRFGDETYGE